jgi:hypothetical protein
MPFSMRQFLNIALFLIIPIHVNMFVFVFCFFSISYKVVKEIWFTFYRVQTEICQLNFSSFQGFFKSNFAFFRHIFVHFRHLITVIYPAFSLSVFPFLHELLVWYFMHLHFLLKAIHDIPSITIIFKHICQHSAMGISNIALYDKLITDE